MALTGLTALRETLGNRVLKVNKEFKEKSVLRAYRAKQDLRVRLVLKAMWARRGILVIKVLKEYKVKLARLEQRETLETKASKVSRVRKVILEILDRQGLLALREQRVLKVKMVFLLIKLLLLTGSSEQKHNG
jgi:hypothetical protein